MYGAGHFHRRNLAHWQPGDAIIFVTYRLAGSLPADVLDRLREERRVLSKQPLREGETEREKAVRAGKRMLTSMDEVLHRVTTQADSPCYLSDRRVAQLVQDGLHYWEARRYRLHRYVIMPNHVHILIEPLSVAQAVSLCSQTDDPTHYSLSLIMQSLKGYSGRKANAILGRNGPFWQEESFDHWVRDKREYDRIVEYIDMNPVNAGLCCVPEEWKWSSAGEKRRT